MKSRIALAFVGMTAFLSCDDASNPTSTPAEAGILPRMLASSGSLPPVSHVELALVQENEIVQIRNVPYKPGTSVALGKVRAGSSFTIAVVGYDSTSGGRVGRWSGSAQGVGQKDDGTRQIVDVPLEQPSAEAPMLLGSDSSLVINGSGDTLGLEIRSVTLPAGTRYTLDASDPRVSRTAMTATSSAVAIPSGAVLVASTPRASSAATGALAARWSDLDSLWSPLQSWAFKPFIADSVLDSDTSITFAYSLWTVPFGFTRPYGSSVEIAPGKSGRMTKYIDSVGSDVSKVLVRYETDRHSVVMINSLQDSVVALRNTDPTMITVRHTNVLGVSRDDTILVYHRKTPSMPETAPWNPAIDYGTLSDKRDGRVYKTVKIGARRWMAENLAYASPGSLAYMNSTDSARKYGRLYQDTWSKGIVDSCSSSTVECPDKAVVQGVCPDGWHIPSLNEYLGLIELANHAGGEVWFAGSYELAAKNLRSSGGWIGSSSDKGMDPNGTDRLGFRDIPSGYADSNGVVRNVGVASQYWSAIGHQWGNSSIVDWGALASSVRCVENTTDTVAHSDALSSLSIEPGRLAPRFADDTSKARFKDTVDAGVRAVTIHAVPADPTSKVTYWAWSELASVMQTSDSVLPLNPWGQTQAGFDVVTIDGNVRDFNLTVYHRLDPGTAMNALQSSTGRTLFKSPDSSKITDTISIQDSTYWFHMGLVDTASQVVVTGALKSISITRRGDGAYVVHNVQNLTLRSNTITIAISKPYSATRRYVITLAKI